MSAYIVSAETMNRVVNTIMRETREFNCHSTCYAGGGEFEKTATRIGNELFALNNFSVNEHYGKDDSVPPFRFCETMPRKPEAQLKSLQCLICQCSEGAAMDQPIYRELKKLANQIANQIISNLPDYDNAPWG